MYLCMYACKKGKCSTIGKCRLFCQSTNLKLQPLIRASHECRDLVDVAKKYHLRPDLRPQMIGPLFCARAGEYQCFKM